MAYIECFWLGANFTAVAIKDDDKSVSANKDIKLTFDEYSLEKENILKEYEDFKQGKPVTWKFSEVKD